MPRACFLDHEVSCKSLCPKINETERSHCASNMTGNETRDGSRIVVQVSENARRNWRHARLQRIFW
jgi:hypothetical protein